MNEITQNEFLNRYIEQNSKMVEFMTGINITLQQINDNNVLHKQTLEENTGVTKEAIESFKASVDQQNRQFNTWRLFMFLLIVAIIILAGVEKASKLYELVGPIN